MGTAIAARQLSGPETGPESVGTGPENFIPGRGGSAGIIDSPRSLSHNLYAIRFPNTSTRILRIYYYGFMTPPLRLSAKSQKTESDGFDIVEFEKSDIKRVCFNNNNPAAVGNRMGDARRSTQFQNYTSIKQIDFIFFFIRLQKQIYALEKKNDLFILMTFFFLL